MYRNKSIGVGEPPFSQDASRATRAQRESHRARFMAWPEVRSIAMPSRKRHGVYPKTRERPAPSDAERRAFHHPLNPGQPTFMLTAPAPRFTFQLAYRTGLPEAKPAHPPRGLHQW